MNVTFREVDPFNLWIWLNFVEVPNQAEKNYIDAVFDSWYVLGRLGGFNGENLQVNDQGNDLNWMNYDSEEKNKVLPALMHNLAQVEYQAEWARCWVDLGTCDGIAIDILINTFSQVDNDFVRIKEILIGGMNDNWPITDQPDLIFSRETSKISG